MDPVPPRCTWCTAGRRPADRAVLAFLKDSYSAQPTASPESPASRRSCCTWARGWGTGWPPARRRRPSAVVAIVGAHATYHEHYDTPCSRISRASARDVLGLVSHLDLLRDVGRDAAAAVAASLSLRARWRRWYCLPTCHESEGRVPARPRALPPAQPVDDAAVNQAAAVLASREPTLLLLAAPAPSSRITSASRSHHDRCADARGGVPARQPRGARVPPLERLRLPGRGRAEAAAGRRRVVLAGRLAASFFAYPALPSDLVPDGASVRALADRTRTSSRRSRRSPTASPLAPPPARGAGPARRPTGRLTSTPWPRRSAPPCRRTRSS